MTTHDSSVMHSDGVSPITDLVAELRQLHHADECEMCRDLNNRSADALEAQAKEIETWVDEVKAFNEFSVVQKRLADEAQQERDAARHELLEWSGGAKALRLNIALAERDAAHAVIAEISARLLVHVHPYGDEKISPIPEIDFLRDAYGDGLADDLNRILSAVDSSVLREHDERVWIDGATVGHRFYAEPWSHIQARSPYHRIEGSKTDAD